VFFFILFFTNISLAQPDTDWSVNYGGNLSDHAQSVTATSDDGCIIAGHSYSTNGDIQNAKGEGDVFITKLNRDGVKEWSKNLGGGSFDTAKEILQTADGGYILVGNSSSANSDIQDNCLKQDIFIIKLNSNGNLVWKTAIAGLGVDYAQAAVLNTDGSITLCGYTFSDFANDNEKGSPDGLIAKISSSGALVWISTKGGSRADYLNDIQLTDDGGYILAGTSNSVDGELALNKGLFDAWILKTNAIGTTSWSKTFGGTQYDGANAIANADGDGYVMAGYSSSANGDPIVNKGGKDVWILKVSLNGNKTWSKTYGGSYGDEANDILNIETGFLVAITSDSDDGDKGTSRGAVDGWLIQITDTSNLDSFEVYGGTQNDAINSLAASNNGGFFLAGYSTSTNGDLNNNKGKEDAWVVRLQGVEIPTVDLGGTSEICLGSSVELDATANCNNCTYVWNNGMTDGSIIVSPNVNTNYIVTLTNASGGTNTGSIMVNVNENPSINESVSDVKCNGGSDGQVLLNVSGGQGNLNYNWSNGSTTASINNLTEGTYVVTVTDANACSSTLSTQVNEPIAININPNVTEPGCGGLADGSISLSTSGGTPSYSYFWNTGQTTPTIDNLSGGTYLVTVTDNNDCTEMSSISLSESSSINVNSNVIEPSCNGIEDGSISINVSGGNGALTFNWSTGQTTSTINNLSDGEFIVTVTDDSNCTEIQSFNLEEPSAISITESITEPECNGDSQGSIIVNPSGGNGPYSYEWSSGQTTSTINNLSGGNYNLTVTDNNNCEGTDTYFIDEPAAISINTNVEIASCNGGSDGMIEVDVEGGMMPYSFSWDNGMTTESIEGIEAGMYTLLVTDANNCQSVKTVNVGEPVPLGVLFNVTEPTTSNNGSIMVTPYGGISPYMIDWSTGTSGPQINNLEPGTYTVTITDNNACTYEEDYNLYYLSNNVIEESKLSIFPNPTSEKLQVQLENINVPTSLDVRTIDGKLLKRHSNIILSDGYELNVSSLPDGIYILKVFVDDQVLVRKFVIQ